MKYDFLIVGAGFAGSVMAERIATQLNKKVLLVEKRNHIGGNAYDEYDDQGILVHRFGPHIFHTNSKMVFDYLSQFTEWRFYEHKVLAFHEGEYYPMPINRTTLNKLFKLNLQNESDVEEYFNKVRTNRYPILNSEDIIVNQIGYDLFNRFYKNYTKKQWGVQPIELSASVCGRIPIRLNTDCRYFTDKYQFMPKEGYSIMFGRMLHHKNIEILLNTDYKSIINDIDFTKMIYTGPIDYYYGYKYGMLPYRSVRFEYENHNRKYFQESAQINHVDKSVDYTRVVEHKYLSGQETKTTTTISKEYPQVSGEPLYPIPTLDNRILYEKYENETKEKGNVVFCGRLAEYKYYNMDQVIGKCLQLFNKRIS